MRVLLDHCLPRRLKQSLSSHLVRTAAEMGWERLRNGTLLATAATEFDVFLTIDKKIKHEQNLATLPVSVVVILAPTNRLQDLTPFVPGIEEALGKLRPRTLVEVAPPRP